MITAEQAKQWEQETADLKVAIGKLERSLVACEARADKLRVLTIAIWQRAQTSSDVSMENYVASVIMGSSDRALKKMAQLDE